MTHDNGTDRQTDRVRRNMRPPPREEGRITRYTYLFFTVFSGAKWVVLLIQVWIGFVKVFNT